MNEDTLFPSEDFFETQLDKIDLRRQKSSVDEAREFGGWSVDKLEILRLYFQVYRRVAGNGTYIDGFAGTGRIQSGGLEYPGSAALAVSSQAFKEMRLYETRKILPILNDWLDNNVPEKRRSRVTTFGGDFNKLIVDHLDNDDIRKDKPCFAFLDPNSTQLSWETVEALARYKADCNPPETCRIELWILFNTDQALMRLMPKNGKDPQTATLNRWMGEESAWCDLYEGNKSPGAFASRYADRLMNKLGYRLARSLPILDPLTGRRQYYMIHASDHPAAHDFMRWAAKKAHPAGSTPVPFPGLEDNLK